MGLFQPDPRSIYFQSLMTYPGLQRLAGSFKINSNLIANTTLTIEGQQKYNRALAILKQGQTKELANERIYFTELLNNKILSSPELSPLKEKISTILNATPIDYIALINVINTIILGADEYDAIIKLETTRMEQLDKALEQINKKLEKQQSLSIRHSAKKNSKEEVIVPEWTEVITTQEELQNFLKNEYLEKHQITHFQSEFAGVTKTIDNLASKVVNETIKQVFSSKETLDTLRNIYNNGQDVYKNNFINIILNNILLAITKNKRIETIIETALDPINDKTFNIVQDIIKDITTDLQQIVIKGQTSKFGRVDTKNTAELEVTRKELNNYYIKGDKLADNILETLAQHQNNKKFQMIFDLDKENSETTKALQDLQDALQKLHNLDINQPFYNDDIKSAKQRVATAKTRLSTTARIILEKKLNKKRTEEMKDAFLEQVKAQLTNLKLAISGPTYSEIIDGIRQYLLKNNLFIHSGIQDLKADSIRLSANNAAIQTRMPNKYINDLPTIINDSLTGGMQQFYDSFFSSLPSAGKSTNFAQGKEAFYKGIRDGQTQIQKSIKKQKKNISSQLKQLGLSMRDTIIVTETDKTFNKYFKDIGFVSGSLGPNIATQIQNMQTLFESAGVGMTDEEAQWLEIAIVNCSPAALGTENKDSIERYLSTLAGFAVFDEGAAELEIITERADADILNTSPKLLHLYKLDGLYYPGSYILARIHERLSKALSDFYTGVVEEISDGAHIRATATEQIIQKQEKNMVQRWADTYALANSQYTSIDVSFLSNLLNIAKQLGSIQI